MKPYIGRLVAIILAIVFVFSVASCKSKKANKEGATTTADKDALSDAMNCDGLDEDDIIKSTFLVYENGHYRHNVSKSPEIFYGLTDSMNTGTLKSVMEYVKEYFKTTGNDLPIKPVFREKMERKYYLNETYNSISDFKVSTMTNSGTISSDYAGRTHYTYEKDKNGKNLKDIITSFQIELPQNTAYEEDKGRWEWIVLHEIGHGFGLKDVYDDAYKNETIMYGSMDGYVSDDSPEYFTIDVKALDHLYKK